MRVLVVNVGSSTLKFSILSAGDVAARLRGTIRFGPEPTAMLRTAAGEIEEFESADAIDVHGAITSLIRVLQSRGEHSGMDVIAHRVVHGGKHDRAARIDDDLIVELEALIPLAPLHQPAALSAIKQFRTLMPEARQVACFDSAFFQPLPESARSFAVPDVFTLHQPLRRYGFHGLSHAYIADRVAAERPTGSPVRLVSCHIGSGCSVAAIEGLMPVDTTMGLTPLSGMMMATRCGNLDPDAVLYLLAETQTTTEGLQKILNHASGLRGVSGVSGDYREVQSHAEEGHARAKLALEMFHLSAGKAIAQMAVSLGGVDVLAFTGGIGANSESFRAAVLERLRFMNIGPERTVGGRTVEVQVIHTREDLTMVRDAVNCLNAISD